MGEDLKGNGAVETCIAGAVDFSHPTRAQQDRDLVRTKSRACCEGHGWRDYTAPQLCSIVTELPSSSWATGLGNYPFLTTEAEDRNLRFKRDFEA